MHVENRSGFCKALRERGIETSIVHARNDQCTVFGGPRADLPVLDRFHKTYISIPIHSALTDEQVKHVIASIQRGW
jgi:dTDP-4-amino-4,6-dideoxygalactose transaminase